jgi:hypothetical protein
MRLDADPDALFLTIDLSGHELRPPPARLSPLLVELTIDGRHYKQRRLLGYAGHITIRGGPADGPLEVQFGSLATFGNGYDRKLRPENVPATLTTRSDGSRRVTVTIPRNYFYLHEWAIGNGNSSLGCNVDVYLLEVTPEIPGGHYPPRLRYVLAAPVMSRNDPRALPLFEMTNEPTGRWTARFY